MIAFALRSTGHGAHPAALAALQQVAEPDSPVFEIDSSPFLAAALNEVLYVIQHDQAIEAVVVLDGHTVLAVEGQEPLLVELRRRFATAAVAAVALGPDGAAAGVALSRWAARHVRFQQSPLEAVDLVAAVAGSVEDAGRRAEWWPAAASVAPGATGLRAVGPLFPGPVAGAPAVSVLIPTYNRAALVDQAIASAAAQTFGDIEIVVSDSGSTDGTAEVLDRWAARDPRVWWTSTGHDLGSAYNWHQVLSQARGRYVKWLMSDDLLAPGALARLVGALEQVPEASLAFSKRTMIDMAGRSQPDIGSTQALADRDGLIDGFELGGAALRANLNVIGEPTTVLVRREAFWRGDPWTVDRACYRVNSDLALWLRLLATGPAAYVTEPLSSFRRHGGQDEVVPARAVAEWYQLIDEGHRIGHLRQPGALGEALRRFLTVAATVPEVTPGATRDTVDDHATLAALVARAEARLEAEAEPAPTGS